MLAFSPSVRVSRTLVVISGPSPSLEFCGHPRGQFIGPGDVFGGNNNQDLPVAYQTSAC